MASLPLYPHRLADVLQQQQQHKGTSAASTPFVSAPASPSHPYASTETAAIPFCWEEKPGTPKARGRLNRPAPLAPLALDHDDDDAMDDNSISNSEFEFASARFGDGFLDDPPLSPAPLSSCSSPFFPIQQPPLRPPPRLHLPPDGYHSSVRQLLLQHDGLHIPRAPRSPRSPSAFSCSSSLSGPPSPPSPRIGSLGLRSFCCVVPDEDDAFDPFTAAMETMAGDAPAPLTPTNKRTPPGNSPVTNQATMPKSSSASSSSSTSSSSSSSSSSSPSSKKWKLRNILHRSPKTKDGQTASTSNRTAMVDDRETGQLQQQSVHFNTLRSSFDGRESLINKTTSSSIDVDRDTLQLIKTRRSIDGRETPKLATPPRSPRASTQPPTPTRRSGTGPYAHHYTTQRAQIEEMKRRTSLPYKPGLLGCLGFSSKSYIKAYMANPSPMA